MITNESRKATFGNWTVEQESWWKSAWPEWGYRRDEGAFYWREPRISFGIPGEGVQLAEFSIAQSQGILSDLKKAIERANEWEKP